MKTYEISVNQVTAKWKLMEVLKFCVNSANTLEEIEKYYKEKYKWLWVKFKVIEEIELIEIEWQMKKVEKLKEEIKETSIKEDVDWRNIAYQAFIEYEKINFHKTYKERHHKNRIEANELNAEYEKEVIKQFWLTSIDGFRMEYNWIYFRFYPHNFKFETNQTN